MIEKVVAKQITVHCHVGGEKTSKNHAFPGTIDKRIEEVESKMKARAGQRLHSMPLYAVSKNLGFPLSPGVFFAFNFNASEKTQRCTKASSNSTSAKQIGIEIKKFLLDPVGIYLKNLQPILVISDRFGSYIEVPGVTVTVFQLEGRKLGRLLLRLLR